MEENDTFNGSDEVGLGNSTMKQKAQSEQQILSTKKEAKEVSKSTDQVNDKPASMCLLFFKVSYAC